MALALELPISFDWLFLGLRLAFVGVLYLFLWRALRIVMRDLRESPRPPARRRPTKARIVVVEPAQSGLAVGTAFAVTNRATIGRHPDCTIAIDEPFLSAVHASFEARNGAWYVTDKESTNGTFVNDRQLSGTGYVEADDVLRFGRMEFQFVG